MVSQPFSACVSFRGVRWRLFDAQLYSHLGNDVARVSRRALAPKPVLKFRTTPSHGHRWSDRHRARAGAAFRGRLPSGETDLDAEVDAFQRRLLFPSYGLVLRGD